jgi:hypothetical protein
MSSIHAIPITCITINKCIVNVDLSTNIKVLPNKIITISIDRYQSLKKTILSIG